MRNEARRLVLKPPRRWLALAAAATLAGFVLRMIDLAAVPPRWDEGWSIAHASLSVGDLLAITAADVHPPLYYLFLGAWQQLAGVHLFSARALSAFLSTLSIPLAFAAARVWSRSPKISVVSAFILAWLPLAVYYGAVVRMYALAPAFILLATWAALRLAAPRDSSRDATARIPTATPMIAFLVGATGAMLTLYHAAWPLAALGVYALGAAWTGRPAGLVFSRTRRLTAAILLACLAYLPWAVYALPQLAERAATEAGRNTSQSYPVDYFVRTGLIGLTMSQQIGWAGPALIAALTAAGVAAWAHGKRQHAPLHRSPGLSLLALPALTLGFTLVGVAVAARHWTFNARMLIGAAPALAMLIAWSLASLSATRRWLGAVAAFALGLFYLGTSVDFVYQKSLEVFDRYEPRTYYQNLSPDGRAGDMVVFNVLSPAGFYALERQADDPDWSYALTWDPVIEPPERWQARLEQLASGHSRLWLVLYRGLAGRNGDLRGWFDSHLYPAAGWWGDEEVFYGLYGSPQEPLVSSAATPAKWGHLELRQAHLPKSVSPGQIVPVALIWRAKASLTENAKVFVHAVDEQGRVIAQHDAQPLNDLRPMTSLPPDQDVVDHHGLALPQDYTGVLRIVIGLYDPHSGARVPMDAGGDALELGQVTVR